MSICTPNNDALAYLACPAGTAAGNYDSNPFSWFDAFNHVMWNVGTAHPAWTGGQVMTVSALMLILPALALTVLTTYLIRIWTSKQVETVPALPVGPVWPGPEFRHGRDCSPTVCCTRGADGRIAR